MKWLRELLHDAGIVEKRSTSHRFWHTFTTHLRRSGTDVATLRDLLGHSNWTFPHARGGKVGSTTPV